MKAVATFTFAMALCSTGTAAEPPAQSMKRVAEIAAMLPDEPGFPEVRIDNRELWNSLAKTEEGRYVIRRAEEFLSRPIPTVDDAKYVSSEWVKTFAASARALLRIGHAECLENKGRFLPLAEKYLDFIAARPTWMNPGHDKPVFGNYYGKYRSIDLNGSETALNVAILMDVLKGRLSADLEKRLTEGLRKHVYDPYLGNAAGTGFKHWWFFGDNNWNAACHSQSVGAALRTIGDRETRAKFIEAAERAVPYFLNGFSKEGYCQEGMDYWNYGFSQYLRLGHVVRLATSGKVDLFAHEQAKKCFLYAYGFQLAKNVTPQFGDGTASFPDKLNRFLGELVWPDTKSSSTAGMSRMSSGLELMPLFCRIAPEEFASREALPPFRYPIRTFFEDAQVLVCRPVREGVHTVSACIKGGSNGVSHNHNDAGQFIIAVGNVQMVQDPSGKVYDSDTFGPRRYEHPMLNSYAHAVPLPDGTLQRAGKAFSAKVLRTDFTDPCDEIVLDLKGAYSSTNILKLERRMVYDRANGAVTVSDNALFLKPGTYESPISTFGRIVKRSGENAFTIVRKTRYGERRLDFTVDTCGVEWRLKEEKIPNPQREEPTRWAVVFDTPSTAHSVTFRFSRPAVPAERLGVGMEGLDRGLWDPFPAMQHLKELGIRKVRLQSGWARTEKTKGRLDFSWLDKVMAELKKIGVTPWISLSYGNPIYAATCDGKQTYTGQEMNPLHSSEGLMAWKRYVRAVVSRYKHQVDTWEVWNEPDLSVFLNVGNGGNWADDYVKLVQVTAGVVRELQSYARIVACTASGPVGTERGSALLFEKGIGDVSDIYAFHAYRAIPEAFSRQVGDAFYGALRSRAPHIEFWRGEAGISSQKSGRGALHTLPLSEGMQARWMSRHLVRDLSDPNVSFTSYFHLFDFDHYTHEVTYHYGVLRDKDYSRKPLFHVLQRIKRFFDDGDTVPDSSISLVLNPVDDAASAADSAKVAGAEVYCFRRRGLLFFAFTGSWPAQDEMLPVDVRARAFFGTSDGQFRDPVLLDLVDGSVSRLDMRPSWQAVDMRVKLSNYVKVMTEAAALEPYISLPPRAEAKADASAKTQSTHE